MIDKEMAFKIASQEAVCAAGGFYGLLGTNDYVYGKVFRKAHDRILGTIEGEFKEITEQRLLENDK